MFWMEKMAYDLCHILEASVLPVAPCEQLCGMHSHIHSHTLPAILRENDISKKKRKEKKKERSRNE